MRILQEAKYNVLPLEMALQRLYAGTLPPRAVALVLTTAFTILQALSRRYWRNLVTRPPSILSTYYAQFNRPIFDIMLRYLLWKGSERSIFLRGNFAEAGGA